MFKASLTLYHALLILCQLLSIFWWIYPNVKFYQQEACSEWFLQFRYFIIFTFRTKNLFQGLIILTIYYSMNYNEAGGGDGGFDESQGYYMDRSQSGEEKRKVSGSGERNYSNDFLQTLNDSIENDQKREMLE